MSKQSKEIVLTHDMLHTAASGESVTMQPLHMVMEKNLTTTQAARMLQLYHDHNEQIVEVNRTFENALLPDVGVQLMRQFTLKSPAFAQGVPPSLFSGPEPPRELRIPVGFGEFISLPFGQFLMPGMDDGQAIFTMTKTRNGFAPMVGFRVKRRFKELAESIIDGVESGLQNDSIFCGKAFQIEVTDDDGDSLQIPEISFLDHTELPKIQLVFNRWIERKVNTGVLGRIRRWGTLKASNGKSKYGVLLNGEPGTGKTEVMRQAIFTAAAEGHIAILVKKAEDAVAVLTRFAPQFARTGKLVVVAFEDIDRISRERDKLAQALTLALDGADNKSLNLMVVVTTNHMEQVVGVLRRSGRFDMAMTLPLPDQEAIARLLRLYSNDRLDADIDLAPYLRELVGVIPADISSIIDDAKISGIVRTGEVTDVITEEDLEYAVACFRDRRRDELELTKGEEPKELAQARVFGEALGRTLSERVSEMAFPIEVVAHQGNGLARRGAYGLPIDDEDEFDGEIDDLPW